MGLSRRRRFALVWVVIASLLFQQVAVAALACPREAMPAMSAHCAAMMAGHDLPAPAPLCEKHCAPDQTVPSETAAAQVPALALEPLLFAMLVLPGSRHAPGAQPTLAPSTAPPRLRFCRLLI